jgi:hypothetical protein
MFEVLTLLILRFQSYGMGYHTVSWIGTTNVLEESAASILRVKSGHILNAK